MADAPVTPPDAAPAPPAPPAPPPPVSATVKIPLWLEIALLVGVVLSVGIASFGVYVIWRNDHPAPVQKPYDPAFVGIGESYGAQIAPAYATAFDDGAAMLDAGQPYSAVAKNVADSWTSGRQAVFDKLVSPALAKVMPPATKDGDMTPQQRAAMAAAWRGFAMGLKK